MAEPVHNPALTYQDYFGPAIFTPLSVPVLAAAKPQPGERVLDVACGTGIVTRQLASAVGSTGRVVGFDLSAGMLEVARGLATPAGAPIEWREGNAIVLDLPDASFDLVVCQQGLQFFPDRRAATREMRRVLAPNGRAVLAVWRSLEQQTLFHAMVRAENKHLGLSADEATAPFSFPDPDALRALLLAAGFTHVDMQQHTIDVRFPMPEKFVKLTVIGAAAVMPQFVDIDVDELTAKVTKDIEPELAKYRDGDAVRFPLVTNLAIAYG
ncbi:MAG: class I SAM-dependent methyltransferase [Kofleriaceae bacterium]